jgi:hypothetical protein
MAKETPQNTNLHKLRAMEGTKADKNFVAKGKIKEPVKPKAKK